MSWLVIVVLLVVFVVRMWLSMVTRRRQRASVEARVPAQRTPPAPVERPSTAGLQPSGDLAASLGDLPGPVPQAPQPAVHVGAELEGRVRALMSSGFEAGAVRLLCDELGIGIHDAQQTVRALTGHPRADAASQDSASR